MLIPNSGNGFAETADATVDSYFLPITLILFNAFRIRSVALPPQPPPSKEELARYDDNKNAKDPMHIFEFNAVAMMKLFNVLVLSMSLTEVYLILSQKPSRQVLPFLHNNIPELSVSYILSMTPPSSLFGTVLIQIGSQLRLWCFRTLGTQFTFELSVVRGHKLVTSGLYSIVRHPAYLGISMISCGLILVAIRPNSLLSDYRIWRWRIEVGGLVSFPVGIAISAIWLFCVSIVSVTMIQRIPKEDLVMKMEFKEQWERWAKKTPYRLIPFVY
ncbi:Protein-S-isoprenylcysteine O-methyltransferase [Abortiporus biennis]